jgi:hypothetical protein
MSAASGKAILRVEMPAESAFGSFPTDIPVTIE